MLPRIAEIHFNKATGKATIKLSDDQLCFVPGVLVRVAGLAVGRPLDPETFRQQQRGAELELCHEAALKLLSFGDNSLSQLRKKLLRKGYLEDLVEETLQWTQGQNLVDDERLAASVLRKHSSTAPKGRRTIKAELFRRGVESAIVEKVLANRSDEDELAAAVIAARKKLHSLTRVSSSDTDLGVRQKVVAFLSRGGWDWETIEKALRLAETEGL